MGFYTSGVKGLSRPRPLSPCLTMTISRILHFLRWVSPRERSKPLRLAHRFLMTWCPHLTGFCRPFFNHFSHPVVRCTEQYPVPLVSMLCLFSLNSCVRNITLLYAWLATAHPYKPKPEFLFPYTLSFSSLQPHTRTSLDCSSTCSIKAFVRMCSSYLLACPISSRLGTHCWQLLYVPSFLFSVWVHHRSSIKVL